MKSFLLNLYSDVMDEIKALYLICEGKRDAEILHTLLDCKSFQKVYQLPSGGYGNLSSVARTIRLMRSPMESNDKIIIAFDADSLSEQVCNERIATMRYLTNADYDKRLGVFCFPPTIEQYLFHSDFKELKKDRVTLIDYLKKNYDALRDMDIIKDMQEFIDE